MKPINTIPIETFFEKVRAASRSGQRGVTIDIVEAQSLSDSVAILLARLAGDQPPPPEVRTSMQINADGGGFR